MVLTYIAMIYQNYIIPNLKEYFQKIPSNG